LLRTSRRASFSYTDSVINGGRLRMGQGKNGARHPRHRAARNRSVCGDSRRRISNRSLTLIGLWIGAGSLIFSAGQFVIAISAMSVGTGGPEIALATPTANAQPRVPRGRAFTPDGRLVARVGQEDAGVWVWTVPAAKASETTVVR
jgi:hypothetical protein